MYTIYAHINSINKKAYIGITKRKPEERWGKNGYGYRKQTKFFNAILKYGWNNFEHKILEKAESEDIALEKEAYYIQKFDSIQNGYNIAPLGCKDISPKKPVFCLSTNTLYESISEAARKNETVPNEIIRNCQGKSGKVKNKEWTYWDVKNAVPKEKQIFSQDYSYCSKKIYCIELDQTFNSIKQASKELNLEYQPLLNTINGKRRQSLYNLHFIYEDSPIRNNTVEKLKRIIGDKRNGNYRSIICLETKEIFFTAKEAAIFCQRTAQSVMKNCQKKVKRCGDYHFQYLDCYIKDNNYAEHVLKNIQCNFRKKWKSKYRGEEEE